MTQSWHLSMAHNNEIWTSLDNQAWHEVIIPDWLTSLVRGLHSWAKPGLGPKVLPPMGNSFGNIHLMILPCSLNQELIIFIFCGNGLVRLILLLDLKKPTKIKTRWFKNTTGINFINCNFSFNLRGLGINGDA